MKQNKDFKKILRNAKLKSTNSRLAVLKVLSEVKHPETTQEIHKRLSAKGGSISSGKNIDLVTLYRTIASFEKREILKRVDLHKDTTYYELNAEHHHHLICVNCDKVENFENKKVEKIIEEIFKKSEKFKSLREHSFELFGLCKKCA